MTTDEARALLARHPDHAENLLKAAADLAIQPLDPATRRWVFAFLACSNLPHTTSRVTHRH